MSRLIKGYEIRIWVMDRSQLVDWPDNKPKALRVCHPEGKTSFNDVFENSEPHRTKGHKLNSLEKS